MSTTAADKQLFMLMYVRQYPMQAGQGQLFGLSQSNATMWIHLLSNAATQAIHVSVYVRPRVMSA
jgi:hypothetical protein